ncbi:DUF4255 domain-containing protein [Sphingomonas quercus]|uniref:DUF4255 domain-containing protein n=1 Tax=Sphingomonas quercus TaxID=2842451 RepID=A0ABS6BMI9_9SPHN|nr:DUF4255 domain-containing protein [Sphingomonas quercus]MBU3079001.1 DUF4255 domain-containing protein [Sphingomonas quercus]
MADHTAIAAVSMTLRTLLLDRMTMPVQVTLAPPDVSIAGQDGARVNLYLSEVVENGQLKNQEIPGRGSPGAYGRPPLSLNLRYLLTTYSDSETQADSDLNAQRILGDAMRVLHDFAPGLDTLAIVNPAAGVVGDPVLDAALADEFERVKVTLHHASLDEVARLWAALPEAAFRRSVMYEVTVVQIETTRPRPRPRPVETRRIMASVRRRPHILAAYVTPAPSEPIGESRVRIGDEITIVAEQMLADKLYVRLGTLAPIRIVPGGSGEVCITLPGATYAADLDHSAPRAVPPAEQLQIGPLDVQLIAEHPADGVAGGLGRGANVQLPRLYASNAVVLQLVPRITALVPASGTGATTLEVQGTRLWNAKVHTAEVILGDIALPIPAAGATATSVKVPLAEAAALLPAPAAAGTPYPIAVQLDGARSRDPVSFLLKP